MKLTSRVSTLLFGWLALLPVLALGQPDANNPPKAQNPPNWGANMGGVQFTQAQTDQLAALTQESQEISQKRSLVMAGVTDPKAQEAVVAFLKDQETRRAALRDQWVHLASALRDGATTDTQLAGLLNDFRASVDDEKKARADDLVAVSDLLGLAKNPRLDASLMMTGLLGDESSVVNTNPANGIPGMGAFGGMFPGMGAFGGLGGPVVH